MQIYQQSSGKIQNSTRSTAEPHKLWLVARLKNFLQLLSCFFFTRAHLQAHGYCPQPCLSSPSPLLDSDLCQNQKTSACRLLLPLLSVSGGDFSLFKEASFISMRTTAVQHYQVFPQSRYFGLGQVVVLHIADNINNKSLQSPEICSKQKKQILQYILL